MFILLQLHLIHLSLLNAGTENPTPRQRSHLLNRMMEATNELLKGQLQQYQGYQRRYQNLRHGKTQLVFMGKAAQAIGRVFLRMFLSWLPFAHRMFYGLPQ